jgi:acyl carrier protein
MNDEHLIGQLREIMADSFGVDESDLPDSPTQATFARWTSLFHMILLVALEEHFGLSFSMDEMTSMTSLDQIVEVLRDRHVVGLPA